MTHPKPVLDFIAATLGTDFTNKGEVIWAGNATGHNLDLCTRNHGREIIMDFRRWGTQGAQPRFQVGRVMQNAEKLVIRPQDHNPWRIEGIDHPDAVFIAAAYTNARAVVERLRALEDALAYARRFLKEADVDTAYIDATLAGMTAPAEAKPHAA